MVKLMLSESTWKLLEQARLEGETDNDVINRIMTKALEYLEAEGQMSKLTKDPQALMRRWMEVYMNLSILMSTDPHVTEVLGEMKLKLGEANEYVMKFFDLLGVELESE